MEIIIPGLILLGFGGVIWLAVWLIGRRAIKPPLLAVGTEPVQKQQEAILVLKPGGKVEYANPYTWEMFSLDKKEPINLAYLASRLRPNEQFFALALHEGQNRFILDGKLVHASSFSLNVQPTPLQVISFRRIDLVPGAVETQSGATTELLQAFSEVSESITSSLEILPTLQSILESIQKFLSIDYFEIGIWESEAGVVVSYQYNNLGKVDAKVKPIKLRYHSGEGFVGKIVETRKPLLLSSIDSAAFAESGLDVHLVPLKSYLGVPLMVLDELIGTLSVGTFTGKSLQKEDLAVINLISGQASTAIRNARLYARENQRATELTGLGELAQAVISTRDPSALFAQLVQSINELMHFEVMGFLIYNPNRRMLEAQQPFHGLPLQFVNMFQISIPLESEAERILLNQEVILAKDARTDSKCNILGLKEFALAAGMRDTLLFPLVSAGRMLGYLQFSNADEGPETINQDLLRLLQIVANQVAPIIENAELVQRSRERAQRAETLSRIASFASSSATLNEILDHSLRELAGLLKPDASLIMLVDIDRTRLILQNNSSSNLAGNGFPDQLELLYSDPQFPFTFTARRRPHLSNTQFGKETAIVPFYKDMLEKMEAESWIVAPLISHNEGLGEIWLIKKRPDFFTQIDLQFLSTTASQLAGVVDQAYLAAQTDASLRRKVDQLTVMTRISRELSTSLDLQHLLHLVYEEALSITGASCGSLILFDLSSPIPWEMAPRFYVGDTPPEELSSLEVQVLESGVQMNLGQLDESVSVRLHEGVGSVLIVPIQYQQIPAGLVILHAKEENFFDDSAMEITQSLAAQAAIALGNALQYEKQKHRGELLQRQNDILREFEFLITSFSSGNTLAEALGAVAKSIHKAMGYEFVIICQKETESGLVRIKASAGEQVTEWQLAGGSEIEWETVQTYLLSEYQLESLYFVAGEKGLFTPQILSDTAMATAPLDWLVLPVMVPSGESSGLVCVSIPRGAVKPDRQTIESLNMFGLLAAWLMDSPNQAVGTLETIDHLKVEQVKSADEISRLQDELAKVLQTEDAQIKTIHSLYRQMEQLLDGIEIAELINRQTDIPSAMKVFAQELQSRFDLDTILIGEKNGVDLRLIETYGIIPGGVNPDALFGQNNLLRDVLLNGKMVYSPGNANDPLLQDDPYLRIFRAMRYVSFQLPIDDETTMAILAVSSHPDTTYKEHTERMYLQLGRQVSVSLQNLALLYETRHHLQDVNLLLDFSRSLGSLNEIDVLHSVLRHVSLVLEQAEAGWVGIYHKEKGVLVPAYALGYPDSKAVLSIRYPIRLGQIGENAVLPIPERVCLTGEPSRLDEIDFARDFHLSTDDLVCYRKATSGKLPLSSLCVPMKLGDQILGVILVESFSNINAFSQEDEILVYSLAQQATLALDNSRLYSDAERRATQLEMLTKEVSEMGAILDRDHLIKMVLSALKRVIPFDTATLWLRSGKDLVVEAVHGFADGEQRLHLSTTVEDSVLFQEMDQTNQPISVPDTRKDSRFSALIEPEYASWLGVPLMAKKELLGVIALEKKEAGYYSSDLVQLSTTFALMAASALDNARLYELSVERTEELDLRSDRLAMITDFSRKLNSTLQIEQALQVTVVQLHHSLNADRSAMITCFGKEPVSLRYEVPSYNAEVELPEAPVYAYLRESMGIMAVSRVDQEPMLQPLLDKFFQPRGVQSLLVVPLIHADKVLGWVWLMKTTQYAFTSDEIDLARTLGNQAAIGVQNARLYAEARQLKDDLERRVEERTAELTQEHKYTQALLTIITRLSVGLDASRVIGDVLEEVNHVVGADSSLILRSDGSKNYYAGMTQDDILKVDGDLGGTLWDVARQALRSHKAVLIDNILDDPKWNSHWFELSEYRSLVAQPMFLDEEVLGTLFIFSKHPGTFYPDQLSLIEAAASQFSIAMNNSNLYHLAKSQSESLSIMLRNQQTILESIVDGVLVTDLDNRIALFNSSAERILNLPTMDVIGRSLEQFSGLFGKAASEWMAKIKKWSVDPFSHRLDEVHAETITLDNGKIVSVHLAPVVWGMEFLGTVSIFRDITSEVKLDRLKSEFVANVSHELRTPLTAIKGYMEILLMGAVGEFNSQQEHFLQVVNNNADRLNVLVDDLLDISRIEAGQIELNIAALDIKSIANDVVDEIKRRMVQDSKPMTIEIHVDEHLPAVAGDALRVRQVFYNLVSNAYQYTPSEGMITIQLEQHQDEIQVSVKDNGIGIAPEYRERIFERFFRGEDQLVLASAGTGLGLSISKTMIEMLHGRIWFFSSGVRGEGSIFYFALPVFREG